MARRGNHDRHSQGMPEDGGAYSETQQSATAHREQRCMRGKGCSRGRTVECTNQSERTTNFLSACSGGYGIVLTGASGPPSCLWACADIVYGVWSMGVSRGISAVTWTQVVVEDRGNLRAVERRSGTDYGGSARGANERSYRQIAAFGRVCESATDDRARRPACVPPPRRPAGLARQDARGIGYDA